MRLLGFVALALSIAGVAAAGSPEESAVKVEHHAGPVLGEGSGTVVWAGAGKSWVLTNFHVAPDDGTGIAVVLGGKRYPARRIGWNPGLDLCGLEIDAELPVAPIAKVPAKPGEHLYQWGHAGGSDRAVPKEGACLETAGRRAVAGGGLVMQTTIDAREGDSGCGVFNARGELVAVCWGRHSDHPGQSCVTLQDVRAFLHLDQRP